MFSFEKIIIIIVKINPFVKQICLLHDRSRVIDGGGKKTSGEGDEGRGRRRKRMKRKRKRPGSDY